MFGATIQADSLEQVLAEQAALAYRQLRKRDYILELSPEGEPLESLGDPMDTLIKQVEALLAATGHSATPEFAELLSKVAAIKARHPKPNP